MKYDIYLIVHEKFNSPLLFHLLMVYCDEEYWGELLFCTYIDNELIF